GDVTPQGMKITSCGLTECIEKARAHREEDSSPRDGGRVGWGADSQDSSPRDGGREGWGADSQDSSPRDGGRVGWGAACYIHVGGGARIYQSDGCGSLLKIDEAGRVTLISGASELGQGSETVLAMVVAEQLGVPLQAVSVVQSDTEIKPWDVGAHASRTTFVAGNSARIAALELRGRLLETAAEVLEADPADLEIADGRISVRGVPDRSVDYARVVRRRLLRQGGGLLVADAFYDPPTEPQDRGYRGNISAAYGFGCHLAQVRVDTETGLVELLNLWCVHDVGRALNPAGVEGQVQG